MGQSWFDNHGVLLIKYFHQKILDFFFICCRCLIYFSLIVTWLYNKFVVVTVKCKKNNRLFWVTLNCLKDGKNKKRTIQLNHLLILSFCWGSNSLSIFRQKKITWRWKKEARIIKCCEHRLYDGSHIDMGCVKFRP